MYVHADMLATHENDTTLTGPKMEQERQMSPNGGPTFSDMLLKCHPTHYCHVKIADADIRQTQLRRCAIHVIMDGMCLGTSNDLIKHVQIISSVCIHL
jgi:hypothetical protein